MRNVVSLISILLVFTVPGLGFDRAVAGDGCCGRVAAPSPAVMVAPVLVPQPLPVMPAPCCGSVAVLPLAAYPSYLLVPVGYHVRHPYYSYRAPWSVPGPPQINRTIAW